MVNALIRLVLLAMEVLNVSHKVLVLNGPNLNMLRAAQLKLTVDFRQTNDEGELVTWIQSARTSNTSGGAQAIILNAAAYTHTSVAVLDALLACGVPIVEVHLSNIYKREEFRHHSYVSRAATGIICGFGAQGYELALDAVARLLTDQK
jgi:3-dehydroquinate dehydratase II